MVVDQMFKLATVQRTLEYHADVRSNNRDKPKWLLFTMSPGFFYKSKLLVYDYLAHIWLCSD